MESESRPKLNAQIYEEACEWLVEFRADDVSPAARRRFDAWIRKSPENLGAYLEIAAIWNEGRGLDPQREYGTERLLIQAAQDDSNVVELTRAPQPGVRPHRARRPVLLAASVAALALCAGLAAWLTRSPTYATQTGEQRSILLSDGSTIELNSRSKIRVRLTKESRSIDLLAGQALFKVAKDPARPFVVQSGVTRVRALGTWFDVYRKHSGTVVTVVEGLVAVESARMPGAAAAVRRDMLLDAGEQVKVTSTAMERSPQANVSTVTAWTRRQLVFDGATLSEVAEEFNRYNERQLLVDEQGLGDFHISGVFSSSDPASLVRFLRERRGVRVVETGSQIRFERR